jgi:hypothetical protein
MYHADRQPSFMLALAAAMVANLAGVFVSVVYSQTIVSISLNALLVAPFGVVQSAFTHGGPLRWYILAALGVFVLQLFLRAMVARWVIVTDGAAVTFRRALLAFVIADAFSTFLTAVIVSGHLYGALFLLGWSGVLVSAVVLSSASGTTGAGTPGGTYIRPPGASGDWPPR